MGEDTSTADVPKESDEPQELSKRARKRLLKKEKWLEHRPIKRARERERLKQKRREAKMNNIDLGPSRKAMKSHKMALSNCKTRVCLDFSFDHLMSDKELNKCVNQMGRCYSTNRRTQNPLQFHITNFHGLSKTIAQKHDGFLHWDVHYHDKHYSEVFKKEELVYLTSDSDNIIEKLSDDEVYIIGALVDHNSQKGLCLKIAEDAGIKHARLPIDKYVEMKTRKVLTIDHVFAIMANVACCSLSWEEAFLKVLPQRKGARSKDDHMSNSESEDDEKEVAEDNDVGVTEKDLGVTGDGVCETEKTVGVRDGSVCVNDGNEM